MKKNFEIPQLTIAQFKLENVVTESAASTYEQDAAQFTISGDANYKDQVIQWIF